MGRRYLNSQIRPPSRTAILLMAAIGTELFVSTIVFTQTNIRLSNSTSKMKQRSLLLRIHNLSSFDTNDIKEKTASFDMIFRETTARSSTTKVFKANPIEEVNMAQDVECPCTIEFQSGESSDLPDDIGDDWAMADDDTCSTDFHPIQTVTPLGATQASNLYSFYFEDTTMNMSEDERSVSLNDVVSLEGDDYSLQSIQENPEDPEDFWSRSIAFTEETNSFPAQISLASESSREL